MSDIPAIPPGVVIEPNRFYRTAELGCLGKTLSRLLLREARQVVKGVYRGQELHEAYERLLSSCSGSPEYRN